MDSVCSKHMMGNEIFFSDLKKKSGGTITFGDNCNGKVVSIGNECEEPYFKNVY